MDAVDNNLGYFSDSRPEFVLLLIDAMGLFDIIPLKELRQLKAKDPHAFTVNAEKIIKDRYISGWMDLSDVPTFENFLFN